MNEQEIFKKRSEEMATNQATSQEPLPEGILQDSGHLVKPILPENVIDTGVTAIHEVHDAAEVLSQIGTLTGEVALSKPATGNVIELKPKGSPEKASFGKAVVDLRNYLISKRKGGLKNAA